MLYNLSLIHSQVERDSFEGDEEPPSQRMVVKGILSCHLRTDSPIVGRRSPQQWWCEGGVQKESAWKQLQQIHNCKNRKIHHS